MTSLAAARPAPNFANPANPPADLLERVLGLSDEQAARLVEYLLRSRRADLEGAGREALVGELSWWQRVDAQMQIHMNELAVAVEGGRHPKHWRWRSHKQWVVDRVPPGASVLDIGCGASAYLLWLAERGCRVTAVDSDPAKVELARSLMEHPSLSFVCADAMVALPEGPFDIAICSHVIEHLDEPVGLLRALHGAAGRLIVCVPPIDSRWQKLLFRELGLPWMDDPDHVREYTAELLHEQVRAAGWSPIETSVGIDLKVLCEPG